jgi:hypothetical protein
MNNPVAVSSAGCEAGTRTNDPRGGSSGIKWEVYYKELPKSRYSLLRSSLRSGGVCPGTVFIPHLHGVAGYLLSTLASRPECTRL